MYIISGCAGFIGFHMANLLIKKKKIVIGIDNLNNYYSKKLKLERLKVLKKNKFFKFYNFDLCNVQKLNNLLKNLKKFKFIHFAAQPGVIYSFKNPKSYYQNNVIATKSISSCLMKNDVSNFIFISSSSVYGNKKKYPIHENAKLNAINYYASTKITSEKIITSLDGYKLFFSNDFKRRLI